jgi:outer membrane protein
MMATDRIVRGLGVAVVLSLLTALPVAAQTPGAQPPMAVGQEGRPLKIAVINGERVLAESNIGAQVSQEAQAAAAQWDTRIRDKQTEIDTLVAQGQEQRLTLTDEALGRIQQQIEQLNVDLQRLRDDAQRAMNLLGEEAQVRINSVLIPAVERLATEEGFDLILDTRIQGILFFADAIDATDRYIAMVNSNIGGN